MSGSADRTIRLSMLPSSSLNDDRFSLAFFLSQDSERSSSLVFTYWWYSFLIDLISYSRALTRRRSIIGLIRTSLAYLQLLCADEKKMEFIQVQLGFTLISGPSAILSRQVIYTSRSRGERTTSVNRSAERLVFVLSRVFVRMSVIVGTKRGQWAIMFLDSID